MLNINLIFRTDKTNLFYIIMLFMIVNDISTF
jgi:hypothetical protein